MAIKQFNAHMVAFTSMDTKGEKSAVIRGNLDFFCKAKSYLGRNIIVLHTGNETHDYDGEAILVKTDAKTIDKIVEEINTSDPQEGYTRLFFDGRTPKRNAYDFHTFHHRD